MRMRGLTRIFKRVSETPCKQPGQLKHKQWVDVGDDITTGLQIRGRIFKHWHLDLTSYPLAIHHGDFTSASTVQRNTTRSFWTQMRMCKHRVEAMRRVKRKAAERSKTASHERNDCLGKLLNENKCAYKQIIKLQWYPYGVRPSIPNKLGLQVESICCDPQLPHSWNQGEKRRWSGSLTLLRMFENQKT